MVAHSSQILASQTVLRWDPRRLDPIQPTPLPHGDASVAVLTHRGAPLLFELYTLREIRQARSVPVTKSRYEKRGTSLSGVAGGERAVILSSTASIFAFILLSSSLNLSALYWAG